MNNVLEKLSKGELRIKNKSITDLIEVFNTENINIIREKRKLLSKRFVNPKKLENLINKEKEVKELVNVLHEYSDIILCKIQELEDSPGIEIPYKNGEKNISGPIADIIVDTISTRFYNQYETDIIVKGVEICRSFFPFKKLNAMKKFKELSGETPRNSKVFVDYCWEMFK